jgi:hypothetical protein
MVRAEPAGLVPCGRCRKCAPPSIKFARRGDAALRCSSGGGDARRARRSGPLRVAQEARLAAPPYRCSSATVPVPVPSPQFSQLPFFSCLPFRPMQPSSPLSSSPRLRPPGRRLRRQWLLQCAPPKHSQAREGGKTLSTGATPPAHRSAADSAALHIGGRAARRPFFQVVDASSRLATGRCRRRLPLSSYRTRCRRPSGATLARSLAGSSFL